MQYIFSIAEIPFILQLPQEIEMTEAFLPFLIEDCQTGIKIEFEEKEKINFPEEKLIFQNVSFSVFQHGNQKNRVYHDYKDNKKPYAIVNMMSDDEINVSYEKWAKSFFNESKNSFSHIAFEEILLRKNAMILHSSFVSTTYGGILFSGPSGIGKSTQAELWLKHRDAELINGDRTILRKRNNEWKAYGSPYAGSSKCYVNKSDNISAIIMLEKSSKCTIRKLSLSEAFVKVYSGLIINLWNSEYICHIIELVQQLIQDIPVYLLSATKNEESVQIVESVLKGGRENEN